LAVGDRSNGLDAPRSELARHGPIL
jgi:hypothetical protein